MKFGWFKFSCKAPSIDEQPSIEEQVAEYTDPLPVPKSVDLPIVVHELAVIKFTVNTDGSQFGHLSKWHNAGTATGIGNGGEILGFTLPLNRDLKTIKQVSDFKPEEFEVDGDTHRLLAVANDVGGRQINRSRFNRGWGELGINTFLYLQNLKVAIDIRHNYLSVPAGMKLTYRFLDQKIRSEEEYRQLKKNLIQQGRI